MDDVEPLIGLEEAANLLGYSISGLRKILKRSRRRLRGEPVAGPTIRFFQAGPKSPIKFRRQWLEDFVQEHSKNLSEVQLREANPRVQTDRPGEAAVPPELRVKLGFRQELYEI